MAQRNLTSDLLELDTDDYSLETTAPTDLSVSPDTASEAEHGRGKKKKLNRQLLERKQLLHDIQVLKIELSQKSLVIDNLKAENMQRIEELEEKLGDAVHSKQLLQAKLESQIRIQQEDARKRTEQIQKELEAILQRQQELEAANQRLQQKAVDIRRDLQQLDLTDSQYVELAGQDVEELPLRDFVAVKLYEATRPLAAENFQLKARAKQLSDDLHRTESLLERHKEDLELEKQQHEQLQAKYQKQGLMYADTKAQVQHGDYKIENYDRVKSERDDFEVELLDLKKQHTILDASYQNITKERDELEKELSAAKQSLTLLKQDKDYFARNASELSSKLLYHEERAMQLHTQLDEAKAAREELYDKYVASRDQYKTEYENKLREELELIRVRTNTEIDRLKTSTKEMYERENRNLREARDLALSEKDRAQAAEKEATQRYEQLLQDFRQLQMSNDNKMSDVQNELRLKAFAAERTQMVHEETVRTLKECQLENDKMQKKLEVLTKEFYALQTSSERRTAEMETELREKMNKLETYEKLEQELDSVVMQAAEVEDEDQAEKVLFAYGYGANVPTTSRRRLQQSVHLARRVLQLERTNQSLKQQVEREAEKSRQLAGELKNVNEVLEQSQQPYNYLIDGLRLRDAQIKQLKAQLATMEQDVKQLRKERTGLSKSKNQMAADIERLLNQKEEMALMKQVVQSMSHRKSTTAPISPRSRAKMRRPFSSLPKATSDENIQSPGPTEFTKAEAPEWYKRLLSKSQSAASKPRS